MKLNVEIPVSIYKEGNAYVAYAHDLDLATQGDSVEDAKRMFAEAADLFVEGCEEMGTLNDVLENLGWEKINNKWKPPEYIENSMERVRMPA